jgi:Tfp pilus assembly protein PilF
MRRTSFFVCLAAAATAAPAVAQLRADPYAHAAIARADFDQAERKLRAAQRVFPDKPEVLLNLAAVLARTGRSDSARALYRRVLANDDVSLLRADRSTVDAHDLARAGLAKLTTTDTVRYTAR